MLKQGHEITFGTKFDNMKDLVKKTLHYDVVYYDNCPEQVCVVDHTGEASS